MKERLYLFLHSHISNQRLRKFLERKIVSERGGYAYCKAIRKIYKDEYGLIIGYGTYGGCWEKSTLRWQNIHIGNYCSFAGNIDIFRANHPSGTFTTHPITYNPLMGGVKRYTLEKRALNIGHDVWVGQNAIILASCHNVGNGAIIGAGAIVTHDVPPYAIMAGNPAKVIRYRFTSDVIEKIEASQWWLMEKEELASKMDELDKLTK